MKSLLIFKSGALLVQPTPEKEGDLAFFDPLPNSLPDSVSLQKRTFRRKAVVYPYMIFVELD